MCWCETNEKLKTMQIAQAEEKIAALTTEIEELTQLSAQLATEIKNLKKEVEKNQEALDQAAAIRAKELAEFNEEEKDNLEAINALKAAIAVLAKHHEPSFLQVQQSEIQAVSHTQSQMVGLAAKIQ